MSLTLDELRTLVTVVDTGSITAAAEALGQTPSVTSRTLAKLEGKVETTLLRRTTRRMELTEEGAALLERARHILHAVDEAQAHMTERRERPAGRLRVDAATSFLLHVLVPLVPSYCQRYPKVELELVSNEGIIDLIERRTDVAFRIGTLRDSSLHARLIGYSQLRLLASPRYVAAHGAPRQVAQLQSHPLLGFTTPASLNLWPLQSDQEAGLPITPTIAASSGETLRHLALQAAGITCLSDFMTQTDRDSGALVQVLTKHTLPTRQPIHAVYYRNTPLDARINSFVSHVAQAWEPAVLP